ncbi:MAG: helix-turn-helix transcriptional regulator [Lentisphaeria bacterium]|nr:helix-turn-helix transcriptional regulator [Lentisphaeria bacterium]
MSVAKQDNIIFTRKDYPILCSKSKPSVALVSRWHECVEMKLVITGSVTMMIDTETVTAGPGDIIFINPYEVHSNLPVSDAHAAYHLIMLDVDYFATVGAKMPDLRSMMLEEGIRFRNCISNPKAAQILEKVAEEYAQDLPYSHLAVTGLLQALFAILFREETASAKDDSAFEDRVRFYKTVEPAVVKLRDHYQRHFTGDELADMCSVNRHHFCRVFKRAMGMTPVQYQNECRLRIADILLQSGGMSVTEVASAVGFRDEAYFSRAYKNSRGFPPNAAKSKLSK